MKFCFVLLVSIDVWHTSRYSENLKFYNSLRIIFYKIHSDYILKHNKKLSPPPQTCITVCVSQLASSPPLPGFWCTILDLWKLSLVTFCYLLVSFHKSFRRVSTPFVWSHGCFCTISRRCVPRAGGFGCPGLLPEDAASTQILEGWYRQGTVALVHKVMTCLCQRFLYISFISWKKVYFYVFSSMNGTL